MQTALVLLQFGQIEKTGDPLKVVRHCWTCERHE
jgi:hypothetical protein